MSHDASREHEAIPELFDLVSGMIRRNGRAVLAMAADDGGVSGSIVVVLEGQNGAPMFALARDSAEAHLLLKNPRVGLLLADNASAGRRVRLTLVGTATPEIASAALDSRAMAFRVHLERIRFASELCSAWYRVATDA